MIWQDIVLSIGSVIFVIALIPSIMSAHKPAFTTSVLSSLVLVAFTFVYATLDLWLSAVITAFSAILWMVLAFQKSNGKKKSA